MEFYSIQKYVGNLSQIFDVKEYRVETGRAKGVYAIDINNGAALELTVLPDRGMDFYQLKYKGKNLNYITPNGMASPQYYDRSGENWLRSYCGGFLTTCGLSNIGVPCEDIGESLGLHGEISNTPAEHVNIIRKTENGVPFVCISGTMKNAVLFGSNLSLTRTVTMKYGENRIRIRDEIYNGGYKTSPFMILYHFNMGYPLLCEQSVLEIPSKSVTPRNAYAAKHAAEYLKITPPASPYEEMCYYHDLSADQDGNTCVAVRNPVEEIRVAINFNKNLLDHFVQWKMLGCGEYVVGLEPCNATIDGRADARKNGSLKFIEPGQTVTHELEISVMDES